MENADKLKDMLSRVESRQLSHKNERGFSLVPSSHDRRNIYRAFDNKRLRLLALAQMARSLYPEMIDQRSGGLFKPSVVAELKQVGLVIQCENAKNGQYETRIMGHFNGVL